MVKVVAVERDRFDRWVWRNASMVQLWTMIGWAFGGLAGWALIAGLVGWWQSLAFLVPWVLFAGPLAWYLLFWAYTTEEPEDEVKRDYQE